MYREMLIKMEAEETAIAVLDERQLAEIYFEQLSNLRLIGNIYKGVVENVLPGMQAAFVDIGLEKNCFLYVEDALPKYIDDNGQEITEKRNITDILKKGQEILVQVFKEPVGSKGARATTHPALPGRYLVLLPTGKYIAISRRIEDEAERQRLKEMMAQMLPPGMGVIIRTVSNDMGQEELAADLKMLLKQWKRIQGKAVKCSAPSLVHKDFDLLRRVVRDTGSADIDRILVDNEETRDKVKEIINDIAPSLENKIFCHNTDIFKQYDIYEQLARAMRRKVWLKSGGYIIVDQMEALTVIDVNTGKYVGETNLDDTVLKTNLEAAAEVARQLRLRNLGGIIIVDFIDMEISVNKAKVLEALEEAVKKDRTRVTVLGMTQLGLIEMTRKKSGHELSRLLEKECPFCKGKGRIPSEETVGSMLKREILQLAQETLAPAIFVETNNDTAAFLIGLHGYGLEKLEKQTGKRLIIKGNPLLRMEESVVRPAYDDEPSHALAPVAVGQRLRLKVEEPHAEHAFDGIARLEGFVIDIVDGASHLGQEVEVKIEKIFPTYARALIIE